VAGLPAFFIGPYIGGLITMGATGTRLERGATPPASEPAEPDHPVAA
jgi:hypothetical protein